MLVVVVLGPHGPQARAGDPWLWLGVGLRARMGLEALVTVMHNLAAGIESDLTVGLLCPLWLPVVP